MARKKHLEKISDMADQDLRLRALGFFAVGIWHALMRLVLEHGHDGRLAFGQGRMPSLSDIARIRFDMSEAEFITQLITQSKSELLYWDAASETVGWPAELMPDARTLANRANGKKGGRPPKNANPSPQNDPRQRTAMMPIAGGKSMSEGLLPETQIETASRVASLASNNSLKDKAKLDACAVSDEQIDHAYRRIGPVAFETAGFDPARDMGNYGIARQWAADALRSGLNADEAERLILGVVESLAERKRSKGQAISHMGYFTKAIGKAIVDRDVPEAPMNEAEIEADRAWKRDMDTWRERAASGAFNDPIPNRAEYLARAREAA